MDKPAAVVVQEGVGKRAVGRLIVVLACVISWGQRAAESAGSITVVPGQF